MGEAVGPTIKFAPALATRRLVFVTQRFRDQHRRLWAFILGVMRNVRGQVGVMRWSIITDEREWARQKAQAIKKNRPRDVLALGAEEDQRGAEDRAQIMGPTAFLAFISNWENFGLGLSTTM